MLELEKIIPDNWRSHLRPETGSAHFAALSAFLENEWKIETIFPPKEKIFTALSLTSLEDAKVVVIGQDPYHDDNQAHGLAFSVTQGIKFPPSLRNIFKELVDDIGCPQPTSGNLESWANQGVLLINAVLTVRAHQANSHAGQGWESFTDAILAKLSERERPLVFLLWGGFAAKKTALIDSDRHTVLKAPHPSPLSAHRGFFGSKPFSKINEILKRNDECPIEWSLPSGEEYEDLPLFSN